MNNADEIVARLRDRAAFQRKWERDATEIREWLGEEAEKPRPADQLDFAAALIEQQRDEIARLREALGHIARDDHATPDVIGWNDTDSLKAVRKFARRALEGITPAGLDRQGPRHDAG